MYNKELLKKAESGNPGAMRDLAMAYLKGDGVTPNPIEAMTWIEKAAKLGDAEAQAAIADILKGNGDYKSAFEWEEKAANQGRLVSQYNLSIYYREGKGTAKNLENEFYWLQKAAQGGHTNAKHDLALCYAEGTGTTKDYTQAVKWWEQASKEGNAEGKASLGSCYYYALGVTEDKEKGLQLWKEAAAQGSATAKNILSNISVPLSTKRRKTSGDSFIKTIFFIIARNFNFSYGFIGTLSNILLGLSIIIGIISVIGGISDSEFGMMILVIIIVVLPLYFISKFLNKFKNWLEREQSNSKY